MNSAKQTDNKTLKELAKPRRRHWYDHEKLKIIDQYDNNELKFDPKHAHNIIDPKSGYSLPVFLIETWRDSFRTLGLIKKLDIKLTNVTVEPVNTPKVESKQVVTAPVAKQKAVSYTENTDEFQRLVVETMLENQRLKDLVKSFNSVKR